jgi:hypothetical protein
MPGVAGGWGVEDRDQEDLDLSFLLMISILQRPEGAWR